MSFPTSTTSRESHPYLAGSSFFNLENGGSGFQSSSSVYPLTSYSLPPANLPPTPLFSSGSQVFSSTLPSSSLSLAADSAANSFSLVGQSVSRSILEQVQGGALGARSVREFVDQTNRLFGERIEDLQVYREEGKKRLDVCMAHMGCD